MYDCFFSRDEPMPQGFFKKSLVYQAVMSVIISYGVTNEL